jgi:CRP-like cAMP-binding protein
MVFDSVEKALALRSAPLFSTLPLEALLPVANMCRATELAPGDILFEEGEIGDALYVVISGSVAVEKKGEVIATIGAGECVGEMAALDWEPRSATIIAEQATSLIRLDRNDLMDLFADHPDLVGRLANVLVERLRERP